MKFFRIREVIPKVWGPRAKRGYFVDELSRCNCPYCEAVHAKRWSGPSGSYDAARQSIERVFGDEGWKLVTRNDEVS